MTPESRKTREDQIITAAYAVLEEKGYGGVSMQALAKAAKASNETLYRWFGDKQGLFLALVTHNLTDAQAVLDTAVTGDDLVQTLRGFGPVLLGMLVGPRAIALNRAAAADSTGALGAALAMGGREVIRPRIAALMQGADDPEALADLYLTFLVGDLQIRRVTGAMPELTPAAIQARADTALDLFLMVIANAPNNESRRPSGANDTPPKGPQRTGTRGNPFWLGWVRS